MSYLLSCCLLFTLMVTACTGRSFEVKSIKPINGNTGDEIAFKFSVIEAGEDPYNTAQNNMTFRDAKLLLKEFHLTIYESQKVKLSGLYYSLTPNTVHSYYIQDMDLGTLDDTSKWRIRQGNTNTETVYTSTTRVFEVSADNEVRLLEMYVRLRYDSKINNFWQVRVTGHMVDGPHVGTNNTGNETYSVDLK